MSGPQLPSISLLIFRVVNSCGEPVPYSYIMQKPGLEYIFFSCAAAVSGWFFGQLQGWLTDTIVNRACGCETGFWNRLRVKLPVNCLGCFVFQDACCFFFFLSLFLSLTYLNDEECACCQVNRIRLRAYCL